MFKTGLYNATLNRQITELITIDYRSDDNFKQDIINRINTYGVCIVKNVLSSTECSNLAIGMCNDFSYLTQRMSPVFDINNPTTWSVLEELLPVDGMLYQHWGLGQSQTIWDVRTNDKIIDVFSKIYGTDDLLVSFDGINFSLPPEYNKNKVTQYYSEDKWHFDQSLTNSNFECIQGWVNAFDTRDDDSTLCAMIGSQNFHYMYAQLLQQQGQVLKPDDWVRIEDVSFFTNNGCIPYRVEAPAGSLVLWDSRTLHFGSKPLPGRSSPNYRMLVYVCYTPRSLCSQSNLKRKREILLKKGKYGQHRSTNHWPHRPKLFPETPRMWNNPIPNITALPSPLIDPKYKRLTGN